MVEADFGGYVVLVTGGSAGLGRSIAVQTAARGAKAVVINYVRSAEGAQETARLVEAEGAEAVVVQGDVREDADCRRVAEAAQPFGRIDALFNNAGATIFAAHDNLDAVSADDFLGLYTLNVVGPFQMIRAARTLLEAAPQPGAVVNIGSLAGLTGAGSSVPYAASKAALGTLTLSLARALAPKIRVNLVAPGFIDSGWWDKATPEIAERARAGAAMAAPLDVVSTPDDIAAAAIFLGGRASRHVTGDTLVVDAGTRLGAPPRRKA